MLNKRLQNVNYPISMHAYILAFINLFSVGCGGAQFLLSYYRI